MEYRFIGCKTVNNIKHKHCACKVPFFNVCKSYFNFKRSLLILLFSLLCSNIIFSREDSTATSIVEFDLGADLVSNYVWRGLLIDAAPNIQGWGELSLGGFYFGLWASTNFTGTFYETDIYAGYAIGNFNAMVTDYVAGFSNVFNVKRKETVHVGELTFQYTLSEKIPLQLTAATLMYGADLKVDSIGIDEETYFKDENNYSTYLELMYPASLGDVDFEFAVGGATHKSNFYETKGAAVTNISIKASKAIAVSPKFELPISFQVAVNPELEQIYSVFSLSF